MLSATFNMLYCSNHLFEQLSDYNNRFNITKHKNKVRVNNERSNYSWLGGVSTRICMAC